MSIEASSARPTPNEISGTDLETAFALGSEFLDKTIQALSAFDGYPGYGYPRSNKLEVDISPNPGQQLFFQLSRGVKGLAGVSFEGIRSDGHHDQRQLENIWGLELTEAKAGKIVYRPSSMVGTGEANAVMEGIFTEPGENDIGGEDYYLLVKKTYHIRHIGGLSIAVARQNT